MAHLKVLLLISMTAMSLLHMEVSASLPRQCLPQYNGELPPKIKKLCTALSEIMDLRSEGYYDTGVNDVSEPATLYIVKIDAVQSLLSDILTQYRNATGYLGSAPVMGSGMQPGDVDHVFLRFGKRRR